MNEARLAYYNKEEKFTKPGKQVDWKMTQEICSLASRSRWDWMNQLKDPLIVNHGHALKSPATFPAPETKTKFILCWTTGKQFLLLRRPRKKVNLLTTIAQRSWDSKRSKRNSRFSLKTLFIRSVIKLLKLIVLPSSCISTVKKVGKHQSLR